MLRGSLQSCSKQLENYKIPSYPKTSVTNQNIVHADLIRAIRRLRLQLPCSVRCVHILGHQDNHQNFRNLPRATQLNVMCDFLVKRYLTQLVENGHQADTSALLMGEGMRSKVTSSLRDPVLF